MGRFSAFLLLLLPFAAAAQYTGPALESCRAYAEAEAKRGGAGATAVAFDQDRDLNIERYTKRVGSQFVSSLLFGNGAIVLAQGPAVEMSFVCLLADEKRALFFHWVPRREAPVLAQCRRSAAAGRGMSDCLDPLLQLAESDLTQLNASRFQQAREADLSAGNENLSNAFRRSNEAWRVYRDAECTRRGAAASDAHRACLVELTRRRALDLR
ncbi:MAG: lysozyme inhibitor LprI family protein [Burkholderiales bacterium]